MGNCNAKVKEVPDIGASPPSELTLMKKLELKRVLDADGIKRQDGDAWYVVEAAWVQRWLAFIQGDDTSKKPGPIRNETLLCHNTETKTWGPKPLLRAARREHMGHYRRVNEHVWALWVGCYAGSGPALWVDTPPFEDSSNWILDPAFRGGKGGGGGGQARQSGEGALPPDRLWPSSTPNSLAIGDMEDEGVGEENAAKVAAFFDVVLDSPRVSHGAAAAAAAAAAATGSASVDNSNGTGNGNGNSTGSSRLGNGSGNVSGTRSGNGSGNVNRSSNRSGSNRSGTINNPHGSGSIDGRRKEATEEEGTESRVSSTAKQWMYGGGEGGSME